MFSAPNYTQTPNEFFDSLAKTLKEGELRCVLVFMRQIFGWKKKGDRISITQLMDKTGMERKAVINSVHSLVKKKIIIKHTGQNGLASWYSFAVTQDPDEKDYPPEDENGNPIDDSNNSYQYPKDTGGGYPKDTGGGILKIPTKETLTKEKNPLNPPKGGKSQATPSAKAEELSAHFLQKIKEKKPNFIPKAYKNWPRDFDRMLKKPGRTLEKAKEIIDWLVNDLKALSFVQSASKFDEDWDRLEMRFEAGREKRTMNANRDWALNMKQTYPEQLKALSFNDRLAINRAEDKVLSFALEHEEFKVKFVEMFGGKYV